MQRLMVELSSQTLRLKFFLKMKYDPGFEADLVHGPGVNYEQDLLEYLPMAISNWIMYFDLLVRSRREVESLTKHLELTRRAKLRGERGMMKITRNIRVVPETAVALRIREYQTKQNAKHMDSLLKARHTLKCSLDLCARYYYLSHILKYQSVEVLMCYGYAWSPAIVGKFGDGDDESSDERSDEDNDDEDDDEDGGDNNEVEDEDDSEKDRDGEDEGGDADEVESDDHSDDTPPHHQAANEVEAHIANIASKLLQLADHAKNRHDKLAKQDEKNRSEAFGAYSGAAEGNGRRPKIFVTPPGNLDLPVPTVGPNKALNLRGHAPKPPIAPLPFILAELSPSIKGAKDLETFSPQPKPKIIFQSSSSAPY